MAAKRAPVTPAVRVLREAGVPYSEHIFDYRRHPGAGGAADAIGVDPHLTAKTIVLKTDGGAGVIVLMHGDREVSTKKLARVMGVKGVEPASQRDADRFTGYRFGGTSPLGMKTPVPVYAQETLAELGTVYVNAGSRGFLIGIAGDVLLSLTQATLVDVAVG